jgi:NTE family protein
MTGPPESEVTLDSASPCAVVMSGGASLGAVQVGMLRALAEAEVAIALIVGTSVGAINGAWLAGDPTIEGLARLSELWKGMRRQDILPLNPLHSLWAAAGRTSSLTSSARLRSLIEQQVRFARLEHAAIPLHVVAVDVQSGQDVLLSTGSTVDAVLASSAIPGVLPPVQIGDRLFMDGGVIANTPIVHAISLGAKRVWVLPAGYPCALTAPPRTALAMALQGLAILVEHRLAIDAVKAYDGVDIRIIPPLCPLNVSPADFSHGADLDRRGYEATMGWMADGCPDVRAALLPHSHGSFRSLRNGPDRRD